MFVPRLQNTYRHVRAIYACDRRRGKSALESLLELGAKHLLGKSAHTALRKIFMTGVCPATERTFLQTLRPGFSGAELWGGQKLWQGRFFLDAADPSLWQVYQERFPEKCSAVIDDAEAICRHEFNVLGFGPGSLGTPIDWHQDPKSGYHWPKKFYAALYPVTSMANDADVKLPYELSRMQHLPTLGKAYCLTNDQRYARELVAQLSHWLDDNPYLMGVNWTCAMEVAIRIINILWGLAFIEGSSAVTLQLKKHLLASVYEHGQYVVRHLEYSIHQNGTVANHNHYLSDIVGLVYLAVLFPAFKAASAWLRIGIEALVEEMDRQVYHDGVDYESSISYHRFVLELFTSAALLCRLNGVALPETFWAKLEKMYAFTLHVTRPDGKVPQVGDADDGRLHILSDYGSWDRTDHRYLLSIGAVLFKRPDMKAHAGGFSEDAFWLLGRAGVTAFEALGCASPVLDSKAFPEAGFYIMRAGRSYLLACCNAVGAAGVSNHKHNDLLSFELYIGGRAFVVDPGTYTYTADPQWRNRFRSTSYHNTVVIDGQEQNRFMGNKLWRLTSDAKPFVRQWRSTAAYDWLDAEHTGYHRLACPVSHRRTFYFDKRREQLQITDILHGTGRHTADWYVHFDHGISVESVDANTFVAHADEVKLLLRVVADPSLVAEIQDGWVSRRYGVKLPAKILQLSGVFRERCRVVIDASCL
jgi:hypothetical protein